MAYWIKLNVEILQCRVDQLKELVHADGEVDGHGHLVARDFQPLEDVLDLRVLFLAQSGKADQAVDHRLHLLGGVGVVSANGEGEY